MSIWKRNRQPKLNFFNSLEEAREIEPTSSIGRIFVGVLKYVVYFPVRVGGFVIDSLFLIVKVPLGITFFLGNTFSKEYRKTLRHLPVRVYRLKNSSFAFGLGLVLVSGFLFAGFFAFGGFVSSGLSLKGRVLGSAVDAVTSLKLGQSQLVAKEYMKADQQFLKSWQKFESAREDIERSSVLLKAAALAIPAGRDGLDLLEAGAGLSKVALSGTKIVEGISNLGFNENGILVGDGGLSIQKLEKQYLEIEFNLDNASKYLENVAPENIPEEYRQQVIFAKNQLEEYRSLLPVVRNLMTVVLEFAGPEKNILLLLQNNNELRPTGGFMGTFGNFHANDGTITSRKISSIYDLDGQLKDNYLPPLPMLAVNNRWFLRDSNWFFSYPESARVISDFYSSIENQSPDVVMSLTPVVVTRLLEVTGPIDMQNYGVILNASNFVEQTQIQTSVEYDRGENKPKEMLSDFFPQFLGRLSKLNSEQKKTVFKILLETFASRDVQIFSRNEKVQLALEDLGWSGKILESSRDYLAIVGSNLGGSKTDLFIETSVSLKSSIRESGQVVNNLKIVRRNPLPSVDGLANKSFFRVYVPQGSKLVSSSGFDSVNLDVKFELQGVVHPAVSVWESDAVKSVASGLLVGQESGKTYFGGWIEVNGGGSKEVTLEYELPFKLSALDRYSLIVEKQGGAVPYGLDFELVFPGRNLSFIDSDEEVVGSLVRHWQVSRGVFFGGVLEK